LLHALLPIFWLSISDRGPRPEFWRFCGAKVYSAHTAARNAGRLLMRATPGSGALGKAPAPGKDAPGQKITAGRASGDDASRAEGPAAFGLRPHRASARRVH